MKLSFCIPTYQRVHLLQETLESIVSQTKEVEIVVSDNCSQDGTQAYIEKFAEGYPHLVYHRWSAPVECGVNLLHAVDCARGEYCWLMTDDDKLEPGAIAHVKELLDNYPEVTGISVDVEGYDRLLQHKKRIRTSHKMKTSKLFVSKERGFQELGAWMGYWSAHIVQRKAWQEAKQRGGHEKFLGYHHLYLMVSMLCKKPVWYFTDKKCVAYRADNETFSLDYGAYRRYEIDVVSYKEIGEAFFGKKAPCVEHVRKVVLDCFLCWQIVTLKCRKASWKIYWKILKLSWRYYRSFLGFWYKVLPLIVIPSFMLRGARWIYRKWLKH